MKKLKHCNKCNEDKPLSGFSKLKAAKDGLNYYCKPCQRAANRACWIPYYKKERKRLLKKQVLKIKERTQLLAKLKDKPCADCGNKFPFYSMDFDHVRGKKEFAVSSAGNLKWSRILKEIAKCDVVCANCHRARTYKRDQFGPKKSKRYKRRQK